MNNISYHPIRENEVNEWYCDLKFQNILDHVYYDIIQNGRKFNLNDEELKEYLAMMKKAAINAKTKASFDEAHGYNIALIQGVFRKYFYAKEASFSELIKQKAYFERYTKKWSDFVNEKITHTIHNVISGEKSSGVYIPNNKVNELLDDLKKGGAIKKDLSDFFSNYYSIFIKALEFAKENNLGLLEASGVIAPDYLNHENSFFDSVLENCDEESLKWNEISNNEVDASKEKLNGEAEIKNAKLVSNAKEDKKSIWKKLFG